MSAWNLWWLTWSHCRSWMRLTASLARRHSTGFTITTCCFATSWQRYVRADGCTLNAEEGQTSHVCGNVCESSLKKQSSQPGSETLLNHGFSPTQRAPHPACGRLDLTTSRLTWRWPPSRLHRLRSFNDTSEHLSCTATLNFCLTRHYVRNFFRN